MKHIFTVLLLFSVAVSAEDRSKNFEGFEEGQTAVSLFLGQPTFLRYDYWLNWKTALFFDAGYHFDKYFYGAINYTFYFSNTRDFLKKERNFWNSLLFYGGPGLFGGFKTEDNADDAFKMGVRTFGGVEYLFDGRKYAIRAELGPVFFLQGTTFIELQGALGLTYYFGDGGSNKSIGTFEGEEKPKAKPQVVLPKKIRKIKRKKKSTSEDEFEDF